MILTQQPIQADAPPQGAADVLCCAPSAPIPWFRLAIGLFIAAQTMTLAMAVNITAPEEQATRICVYGGMALATAVVLTLLGWPMLLDGLRELVRGRLTMELLFLGGTLAALGISVHSAFRGGGPVYFDIVSFLVIIYAVGRAISAGSRQRALTALTSLTAPIATARLANERMVSVAEVRAGDQVLVMPGELIPVDGRVVRGQAMVRQTPFTGEWISTVRFAGQDVLAGTACEDGTLLIEATADGQDRQVDRLSRLIELSRCSPTSLQRYADRFVQWFLPLVFALAVGDLCFWIWRGNWQRGLFDGLAILLVACPCAAGLATPLALWSTLGRLARMGLVLQSGDALERLSQVDGVIFDKTGTLSDDHLAIESLATQEDPSMRALALAAVATVERHSSHPVARVLRDLPIPDEAPSIEVVSLRMLPGRGIEAQISVAGGANCILAITRDESAIAEARLRLVATLDGHWMATITLIEHLRSSAAAAVDQLEKMGLPVRIMTGDSEAGAASAARLASTLSGMTPEEKHLAVSQLRHGAIQRPLFVGDGVNDAAAMAAAHASIALAGGAAIAVETASATLHRLDLRLIPQGIELARRTIRTVRANFAWAVIYNAVGIALALSGRLHPVVAACLMALSSGVVAWRSFRMASVVPESRIAHAESPAALINTIHIISLIGQALLLAYLASYGAVAAGAAMAVATAVAVLVCRWTNPSPTWDMLVPMITAGGLGMNIGWLFDNHLAPAPAHACCMAGQSSLYMNLFMLVFGVPAMYLLRRAPQPFSWRLWCCVGPLVLGIPGMILGMYGGSRVAMMLPAMPASAVITAHYLLMMAGMCLGMVIPHALEYFTPSAAAVRRRAF